MTFIIQLIVYIFVVIGSYIGGKLCYYFEQFLARYIKNEELRILIVLVVLTFIGVTIAYIAANLGESLWNNC